MTETHKVPSYTVVCDECGETHDNVREWLDNDSCMPDRGT